MQINHPYEGKDIEESLQAALEPGHVPNATIPERDVGDRLKEMRTKISIRKYAPQIEPSSFSPC